MSDIFIAGHLTDFEKLLFAERHIKDMKKLYDEAVNENTRLHVEIGKMKSLIQEYEHNEKRSKEERKQFRAAQYNKALLEQNNNLIKKNKLLSRTNSDLVTELIKLRNETEINKQIKS